jgi:thiosulfate dehydrogenase
MKSFACMTALALASTCALAGGAGIKDAAAYDVSKLPDDPYGRLVRYGKELTEKTPALLGPEAKNAKLRYAGNNLACASCHEAAGTKSFAIPWVGAHAIFPQYRAREDAISTLEERVNGCMERSMNGKPLPLDSQEMKAFMAYMHFLSKDVPVGTRVEGQGLPAYTPPARRADVQAGAQVYAGKCASCHGADGAGVRAGKAGDGQGYLFPALWGPDSFNNGAGMNRLLTAAAFIKNNMPLGTTHASPQLSDDEAYDVAAYVLSQPRPVKAGLDKDFPARWNKPVDAAFGPYVDGAPAEQHKYGPFQPLMENMKKLRPEAAK